MESGVSGQMWLYIWLALFVLAGLVGGIVSGFFKARKIQNRKFDWAIFRHEMFFATLSLTLTTFVIGSLTALLTQIGWIAFKTGPAPLWVVALEYVGYFLFFDTCFYWAHRAMHVEPWYRWIHKTHHKSTMPHPMTSLSMHPFESVIEGTFVPLFVTLFTIHEATMALVVPTAVAMGLYVHSGHEFLPRWWNRRWLTKWFIPATFHDQHHHYFTGNYGGYTTIWDYVCGTVCNNYERDFDRHHERITEGRAGRSVAEPATET
ncbi:MAG: sterol desaturase family protein [Novosphingobium sp.]|nr:sterol desaturase family protein [Novosphingobium sp.]